MPVVTGGSTSSLVTWTVEVCFNQDPNDPAPPAAVWTDISQRVSNVSWGRGRQYELDTVEAGTLTAQVDNLDGWLTPGNTASPYSPNVVLYRQVRVSAVFGSNTFRMFTGFVTRWPQSYTAAGQRASTSLQATDVLGVLTQTNLTGWANDALLGYTPTWLYPLDDGPSSTLYNASIGAVQPGYAYTVPTAGASQVEPGQQFDATMPGFNGRTFTQLTSVTPSGTNSSTSLLLPGSNLPSSGPWSVSLWFRMDTLPAAGYSVGIMTLMDRLQWANHATVRHQIKITTDSTAAVSVDVIEDTSGGGGGAFVPSVAVGQWHLITLSLSADHKTLRYVFDTNAAAIAATSATPMSFGAVDTFTVGGVNIVQTSQGIQGSVANVALFPVDLCSDASNPCQTVLYPAGTTAFANDRTDQRARRIAAAAGFASRFVVSANGDSVMSAGSTAGQTAADALADVDNTELGLTFARGDGMLVFTPRHARYNPVPVFTFGEQELPYSALAFDYDPTHLVNQAIVNRPNGTSTTVTDVTSVAKNFTHSQTYTLQLSTDVGVRAAAEFLVSRNKDPKLRVSQFSLNPMANTDLIGAALGIEIGTAVQANRRPPGVQAISQTCFVDHLQHSIAFADTGATWTVDYTLTPADTTNYMVWDAPGTVGEWDANNWAY